MYETLELSSYKWRVKNFLMNPGTLVILTPPSADPLCGQRITAAIHRFTSLPTLSNDQFIVGTFTGLHFAWTIIESAPRSERLTPLGKHAKLLAPQQRTTLILVPSAQGRVQFSQGFNPLGLHPYSVASCCSTTPTIWQIDHDVHDSELHWMDGKSRRPKPLRDRTGSWPTMQCRM